jgi:hypothetical protein
MWNFGGMILTRETEVCGNKAIGNVTFPQKLG